MLKKNKVGAEQKATYSKFFLPWLGSIFFSLYFLSLFFLFLPLSYFVVVFIIIIPKPIQTDRQNHRTANIVTYRTIEKKQGSLKIAGLVVLQWINTYLPLWNLSLFLPLLWASLQSIASLLWQVFSIVLLFLFIAWVYFPVLHV